MPSLLEFVRVVFMRSSLPSDGGKATYREREREHKRPRAEFWHWLSCASFAAVAVEV
jgi:hypothetical protein